MRKLLLALLFIAPGVLVGCTGGEDDLDNDPPLSGEDEVKGDFPGNDNLPEEGKADAVYPKQWNELKNLQSPVKSQGSRGVCSIFATTAQVEHLYIKAGMQNPDFSEQYMQWSVKNQVGSFPHTEGSDGSSNLDSVVDYGTVEESAWPYESSPWTSSNDAQCTGGENLPTKCYTNGEPPASATSARKFKLPSNRWINTSPTSIKAHLTTAKTGVVVGMTFFYQSWNHRRSALPVNSEFWSKGYVTYPNAEDKTKSLEQRAGHAILIIGWDDELAVPTRDKDGNIVKDAQGNPVVEKGFWLFKNSWGTSSFGTQHANGAGYGWLSMKYVQEYGSGAIAEPPTLGPQAEAACGDGLDNDGDNATDCDDSDCASSPDCQSNPTVKTYNQSPNASIPDNNPTGVSTTIAVPDSGTVGSVKLTVDIQHTYRGDLTVQLIHAGQTQTIWAEEGGSADNIMSTVDVSGFTGSALSGDWTLKVVDSAAQDTGTIRTWKLEIGVN